jgi:hypothetical protein
MVDAADTTVDPLSVNRLISAYVFSFAFTVCLTRMVCSMIHDKKLLAVPKGKRSGPEMELDDSEKEWADRGAMSAETEG